MLASKRISFGSQTQRAFFCLGMTLSFMLTAMLPTEASNALRYMPEDALGFVLVRNLENVDTKVGRFTQLFGLNSPSPLTFAKLATGLDEGIRQQGDLLVALLPASSKTSEPEPMVLLPVSDYAKFAASIHGDANGEICRVAIAGERVLVAKFGEYALMMDVEHRETMGLMLGLQQSPVASLKPLDSWIEENDAVIAIMPNGVKTLVTLGKKFIVQQQEEFEGELDDPQVVASLLQVGIKAEMFQWLLETLETEIELVAVAVSLDENTNLRVSKRVLLKEGAKLRSAAPLKAKQVSPLLGFADQPFVVAGGGPFPTEWAEAISRLSKTLVKQVQELNGLEGLEAAQLQTLEDNFLSLIKGLKSASIIILPGKESEPFFSNIFGIVKTADAVGYLESYQKAMEFWNEIMKSSTSDISIRYEISRKTVATKKACEVVIDIALAARVPNLVEFDDMLKSMFGEDGKMRQLLVAANQHTLVYGMATEEQLLPLIKLAENNESGLHDSPEVQATLKLTPADAPWKLFISPKGCVAWGKRFAKVFLSNLLTQIPEFPDFDACPPIGLSLNMVDARIEADMVCPVETLKALAAYIEKCKSL